MEEGIDNWLNDCRVDWRRHLTRPFCPFHHSSMWNRPSLRRAGECLSLQYTWSINYTRGCELEIFYGYNWMDKQGSIVLVTGILQAATLSICERWGDCSEENRRRAGGTERGGYGQRLFDQVRFEGWTNILSEYFLTYMIVEPSSFPSTHILRPVDRREWRWGYGVLQSKGRCHVQRKNQEKEWKITEGENGVLPPRWIQWCSLSVDSSIITS